MIYKIKREAKRINNKTAKINSYLFAHKGNRFDAYIVLNNLPQWKIVVNLIKNGSTLVSLKIFRGYADPYKKIPQ